VRRARGSSVPKVVADGPCACAFGVEPGPTTVAVGLTTPYGRPRATTGLVATSAVAVASATSRNVNSLPSGADCAASVTRSSDWTSTSVAFATARTRIARSCTPISSDSRGKRTLQVPLTQTTMVFELGRWRTRDVAGRSDRMRQTVEAQLRIIPTVSVRRLLDRLFGGGQILRTRGRRAGRYQQHRRAQDTISRFPGGTALQRRSHRRERMVQLYVPNSIFGVGQQLVSITGRRDVNPEHDMRTLTTIAFGTMTAISESARIDRLGAVQWTKELTS